ncbi:MAG TPA: CBS domain-containing protein [Burkholderiales bacterium]|nr:CBS domain-containing protein [Burkholderiales bacterium]
MGIKDICSRMVVVAKGGTDLRQAARLMRDHHIGALIVIDGTEWATRPIGIVTDRDIVIAVVAAPGVRPESLTVRDVMARELVVAHEDDGVFEAIEAMQDKGVRRLPVVTAEGRLIGVVTLDDLLRVLANELGGLATAMQRAGRRETTERPVLQRGA